MTNRLAEAVKSAASAGNVAALKQLLETYGVTAVRLDNDPQAPTALHWAAASGKVEAVRFLLAPPIWANPHAPRINDFTPLHAAAMQGHAEVCEELIFAGAMVNVQTIPQLYSPLHSAAFGGHLAAVRVLLAHGAKRGLPNYRGEKAADTARRQGQTEVAKMLEASARPLIFTRQGNDVVYQSVKCADEMPLRHDGDGEVLYHEYGTQLRRTANGQYILSVLCGRAFQYGVEISLTPEEIAQYQAEPSDAFIHELGEEVYNNEPAFASRIIRRC